MNPCHSPYSMYFQEGNQFGPSCHVPFKGIDPTAWQHFAKAHDDGKPAQQSNLCSLREGKYNFLRKNMESPPVLFSNLLDT